MKSLLPIDSEGLDNLIKNNLVITKKEFAKVLQFLPSQENNSIIYFPLMIKCNAKGLDEEKFLNFIFERIVYYVFKHSDYSKNGKILQKHEKEIRELFPKAVARFAKKHPQTGELGELILFLLLESNGVVQLVNKMILKTNSEEFFKGSDADHVRIKNNKLYLYFGESKMHADFDDGLAKAIHDITSFISTTEEFEISSTISIHMDDSKFDEYAELLSDLLLPYSPTSNQYEKVHSVFIGYNWDKFNILQKNSILSDSFLKEEFTTKTPEVYNKIIKRITTSGIIDRTFEFYVLPLNDVDEMRNKFLEKLKNGK